MQKKVKGVWQCRRSYICRLRQINPKDRASNYFDIVVVEGSKSDTRKVDFLQKHNPKLGLVAVVQEM
jgi:hypothetical protein